MIPGHSNRVFSVNYVDENLLISSGWDQRILFWDIRQEKPIDSIFGSNIYGDGIDVNNGLMLCCNHRE